MFLFVNALFIGIQGLMALISAFFYQRTRNAFVSVFMSTALTVLLLTGKLVFIYSIV
jgi:hypothetical protein